MPPHITTNRPSLAPISPPLTGASKEWTYFFKASAKICSANYGADVVWSTNKELGFICWRTPWAPNTTYSTSLGYPNIRKTASDFSASSYIETKCAPRSINGYAFSAVLLKILKVCPAFKICLHILNPITPVPIQPIFILLII